MAINEQADAADNDGIGSRIKSIRRSWKKNQKSFAEMISASQGHLSDVENGKGKPTIEMIVGISTHCGDINMRWLLTGEGEKYVKRFPDNGIDQDVLLISLEIREKFNNRRKLEDQRSASQDVELIVITYEIERNHLYTLMDSGVTRSEAVTAIRSAHGLSVDVEIFEPDDWRDNRSSDIATAIPDNVLAAPKPTSK